MAKRTGSRRQKPRRKPTRSARRPARKARSGRRPVKKAARRRAKSSRAKAAPRAPKKVPNLNRPRRILADIVPTPPSSLDMDRRGSAARSGRAELDQRLQKHGRISPAITAGDVDADWEDAYFTGEEAPGGDNPTPDQEVVDDIGKAIGVQYDDNEELKTGDKVVERDKHRWELDPASAEDYKDRK